MLACAEHPTPSPARWFLALNGKSADDPGVQEAVATMRARGIDLQVQVCTGAGAADALVARAIEARAGVVIAGGGDGTLSEVAGALARRRESAGTLPALGLVPLGTGNDFAGAARIPETPLQALELIHAQPAQAIDLLRVEAGGQEHWCANLASGGFGTQVTLETADGLKQVLGGLAYVLTGLAKLGHIEPVAARVHGAGLDWSGEFIALALGNGRQAGGGQALCPDACIDDGLLDVTIIPELEGELAATLGTALVRGREAALERIATRARLAWVEVDAPVAMTLNLDGEPVEARRFRIACVPGRLRMHLPAGCPLLSLPGNALPVEPALPAGGPALDGDPVPLPA